MSAVTSPLPTPRSITSAHPAVSMRTLVEVELRKMVDTRAGRWLLAGVGAVMIIVLGVALITSDHHARGFANLATLAQFPLGILLPVLGVLAATSEWSQRTVLSTFSLVPSRGRVVTAKILAAVLLALVAFVFAFVVAAVAALIAPAFGTADSDWSISAQQVLELAVYQLCNMLLGVALGTLLLNSGLAIVLYFVLPTIWSGITGAIHGLHGAQTWMDTGTSWMHLVDPDFHMTGTAWAQVATTALVWVALPLAIGLARVLRKEVD